MISPADSSRIDYLRFPLIVGVIYIHAYDIHSQTLDTPALDFIRELMSQGFARTAVPVFFLISGLLFFNGSAPTVKAYPKKLISRAHSLLIPFIFWNCLALSIFAIAQSIPYLGPLFSGQNTPIKDYTWLDVAAAVFGINRYPISYQFWFIRDLMVLILFSPIFAYLLTRTPWILLLPVSAFWLFDIGNHWIPSPEACLFFCMGALISLRNQSLFPSDLVGGVAGITYPFLVVFCTLKTSMIDAGVFHHATVAIGVLALLHASQFISKLPKLERTLLKLSGTSFFVFASHEPILTFVRKAGVRLLQGYGEAPLIGLYLTLPLILAYALTLIYERLHITSPTFLATISGKGGGQKSNTPTTPQNE